MESTKELNFKGAAEKLMARIQTMFDEHNEGEGGLSVVLAEDERNAEHWKLTIALRDARIVVMVTDYWRYPDEVCYFVNFNHENGAFSCEQGTKNPDRAIMDVGQALSFYGELCLREQDNARSIDDVKFELAERAFEMTKGRPIEICPHLSTDKPKTIENFNTLQDILLMAWQQGGQAALRGRKADDFEVEVAQSRPKMR